MEVGPGYKKTEVDVIPEDWNSTTVRGIASRIRNAIVGGPFGSNLVSKDYVDDGIPVVRGQNMGSKFVSGRFVFVSQAKGASLEANLAQAGDLVFTQRGTVGQVSLVPDQPHDRYLISQSQMKLTVNREVADPLFFYYVFNSEKQQEVIRQNKVQTGVPHINLGILRDLPVPQPPPVEQEIIAEALSDADALIESLEQLLTKKRQIKKGAMQELLTGKKHLPGFSEEWQTRQLGEVINYCSSGATPYRGRPDYYTGTVKWITSGELNYNVITDTIEHISEEAVQKTNLKIHPAGTFLMAITGLEASGTRGACGIVGSPATTNQSCMAIYPSIELKTAFLFHYYVMLCIERIGFAILSNRN